MRKNILSRKGAQTQSATALLMVFFASLRLCARKISLTTPVSLDSLGQEGERDVVGVATGVAKFVHHPHRAVSVASVDKNRRGALKFGVGTEPARDRVPGAFIVSRLGVVVFGVQIVIEKDRVVRSGTQQLSRFSHIARDVNKISFKAGREPAMPARIIIEEKNTNRMAFRGV
jgi:hypothetical protein